MPQPECWKSRVLLRSDDSGQGFKTVQFATGISVQFGPEYVFTVDRPDCDWVTDINLQCAQPREASCCFGGG